MNVYKNKNDCDVHVYETKNVFHLNYLRVELQEKLNGSRGEQTKSHIMYFWGLLWPAKWNRRDCIKCRRSLQARQRRSRESWLRFKCLSCESTGEASTFPLPAKFSTLRSESHRDRRLKLTYCVDHTMSFSAGNRNIWYIGPSSILLTLPKGFTHNKFSEE